jgi:hypothetical protein
MTTSPPEDVGPAELSGSATGLFDSLRPIYAAAFDKATFGEQLTWELAGVQMVNTDQGPQTRIIVYVHISTPHPLGANLQRLMLMQIGLTPEQIEREVFGQMQDLFALRTKMLMEANGQLPLPSQGKLILPGS